MDAYFPWDYTYDGIAVDGNKEYKVSVNFTESQIAPFFGNIDSVYDNLYNEYRVLEAIISYTSNNFYMSKDWDASDLGNPTNPLAKAALSVYGSSDPSQLIGVSNIFTVLYNNTNVVGGNFQKAYNSSAFQSEKTQLERAWNNYYNNGYYGYDKGVVVTATSKDDMLIVLYTASGW